MKNKIKLYRIHRTDEWSYDDYDSAVVAATSPETAVTIHPDGDRWDGENWSKFGLSSWTTPDNVVAVEIGVAAPGIKEGQVICASFNAG